MCEKSKEQLQAIKSELFPMGLNFNRYVSSNVWKLVSDEVKKLKLIEPFKKKLKI